MTTVSITTLNRNVDRRQALQAFSGATLSSTFWRVRIGPLQRIADVYVPFGVYMVRYELNDGARKQIFAMDAVSGSLDLFEFPRAPQRQQLEIIMNRNCLPALLDHGRAEDLLRGKILRLIFQQGFFKMREPQLEISREADDLYIPYWLGFYGHATLKCRVLDAVRRRFEGAKARAFFEEWLAA